MNNEEIMEPNAHVNGVTKGPGAIACMLDSISAMKIKQTVNTIWGNVSSRATAALSTESAAPAVDVVETDTEFTLTCELPGVPFDRVSVIFDKGTLRIAGEKIVARASGQLRLNERSKGSFEKKIAVPYPVRLEGITANMCHGVLTIVLPKLQVEQLSEYVVTVRAG